jgi:hypothetical protein
MQLDPVEAKYVQESEQNMFTHQTSHIQSPNLKNDFCGQQNYDLVSIARSKTNLNYVSSSQLG